MLLPDPVLEELLGRLVAEGRVLPFATVSPRRYLIADEVGLGKTIETALILRELASRGELTRALMVVPAGLVNTIGAELQEWEQQEETV